MDKWNSLSQAHKAEVMRLAVSNGIFNLNDIRQVYNEYADGGNLYDDGGWLDGLKKAYHSVMQAVGLEDTKEEIVPTRFHARRAHNTSPTGRASEGLEKRMQNKIISHQNLAGGSNPEYDIPFIPEKKILIDGTTTSTNVLDSLAKYAGIHNRNPQLSQNPLMHSSKYPAPRRLNRNEMLGLSTQETHNGATPYYNYKDNEALYNRALGNSNYFTAFGTIPADNLMRDFHYNNTEVDRIVPPLLDAFQYFAQGDYNRGDPEHTREVNNKGKEVWKNPKVQEWWKTSGKYWYNNPKGPKK